jgi:hypothetical protein
VHTQTRVAGFLILAATALTTGLMTALVGCAPATPGTGAPDAGTPPRTPAASTTSATPTAPPTADAPTAPLPSTPGATVTLPWPAATPSQVAALQSAVDGGAQPWLLDPTEVALAYAAARGWTNADATPASATSVAVRSSAGSHLLTLAQPGKTGNGGIWVVTSDSSQ